MDDDFVPQLTVRVGGTELTDAVYDQLVEVRATTVSGAPGAITLRFLDEDFALYDRQIAGFGDEVVVSISDGSGGRDGASPATVGGGVTSVSLVPGADGSMTLVIAAVGDAGRAPAVSEVATLTWGENLLSLQVDGLPNGTVAVRGTALGDTRLSADRSITLEGAGSRLSGVYRLTRSEHAYTAATGFLTNFEAERDGGPGEREPRPLRS